MAAGGGTAGTTTGVLRPRSVLHNCVSSSGSSRAPGASVTFADADVIAAAADDDDSPAAAAPGGGGGGGRTPQDWVAGLAPRGLGAQTALAGAAVVVGYRLAAGESAVLERACAVAVTVLSVSCGFCALALRLRRSWSGTAAASLLATCCGVELALQHALAAPGPSAAVTAGVLTAAGAACVLSAPLDALAGATVVGLVGLSRCLAVTMLVDVPSGLRPPLVYAAGLAGVAAARCIESALVRGSAETGGVTAGTSAVGGGGGSPASMRRRRASTSAAHHKAYSSYAAARRISLPTLVHKSLVRLMSYIYLR